MDSGDFGVVLGRWIFHCRLLTAMLVLHVRSWVNIESSSVLSIMGE